jgi:hypothetical protein
MVGAAVLWTIDQLGRYDTIKSRVPALMDMVHALGEPSPWLMLAIFVAGFAWVAYFAGDHSWSADGLYQLFNRLSYLGRPYLVFKERVDVRGIPPLPETATLEQWQDRTEASIAAKLRRPHVVCLKVKNDPFTSSPKGRATHVRAYLTFFDSSWNKLFEAIPGAWFDEKPPRNDRELFPYIHSRPIELAAGETRCLAIAVKFPGEEISHALSEGSLGFSEWKNPAWSIGLKGYVQIDFRADRVRETRCLILDYGGIAFGQTPGFVDCPKRLQDPS